MRMMPEILLLTDKMREATLATFDHDGDIDFRIGQAKSGGRRARLAENRDTPLHFLGKTMDGDPPGAWLYPMVAAFRGKR